MLALVKTSFAIKKERFSSAGPLEGAQRRERTLILMISIWNTSGSPPLIFGGLPLSP